MHEPSPHALRRAQQFLPIASSPLPSRRDEEGQQRHLQAPSSAPTLVVELTVDASFSSLPISSSGDFGKAVVDALLLAFSDTARLDALLGAVVLAVCAGEGVSPQACPSPSVVVRLAASTGAAVAADGGSEALLVAGLPLETFVGVVAACGAAGGVALVVTLLVLRSRAARDAGAKGAGADAAPRLARRSAKVAPTPTRVSSPSLQSEPPEDGAVLPERYSGIRQAWVE
jgi:hypothetical protein